MSVALAGKADNAVTNDGSPASAMADYESRRCAVCGARHPVFGFGPPLSAKGTIWACGAHRHEVDRQLTATGQFNPTPAALSATDETATRELLPREPAPPEPAVPQLALF